MFKVIDTDTHKEIKKFDIFDEAKEFITNLYIEQEKPENIMELSPHELYRRYCIIDDCD